MIHFETATHEQMADAKKALKDVACISGNVPNMLFRIGKPEEIRDYTRKLIDICGTDGGYIMDTSALLDEATEENVRMWFDTTHEYGVY